ncbi:hypothetical protein C8R45DRAFT_1040508 [Mycena sanguinolenta]|nr:hypothetical protein C8R45DRAFT_1040508 [Mycena sanguinolenta]
MHYLRVAAMFSILATPALVQSFPAQNYTSSQIPPSSPSATDDESTTADPASFINLPALIVGPILLVATLGIVIFISWTLCGCRRPPQTTKELGEP